MWRENAEEDRPPRWWGCTNGSMRGRCFRWAVVLGLTLGLTRNERREVNFSEKVDDLEKELMGHGRTHIFQGRRQVLLLDYNAVEGTGAVLSRFTMRQRIYSAADENPAVV